MGQKGIPPTKRKIQNITTLSQTVKKRRQNIVIYHICQLITFLAIIKYQLVIQFCHQNYTAEILIHDIWKFMQIAQEGEQ